MPSMPLPSQIQFSRGEVSVDLPGPARGGVSVRLLPTTARALTESHTVVSYQYRKTTAPLWEWRFKVTEVLSAVAMRDFGRFWRSTCFGPAGIFQYVHTGGVVIPNCQFTNRSNPIDRRFGSSFGLSISFTTTTPPDGPLEVE